MKVTKADFITSAEQSEHYPASDLPEIVFAGRSNVGKSSLINSLTGRKGLVKVSKNPGKTRLLNFFNINDKVTFVDIPGYGFANVPAAVVKSWGAMIETYLTERPQLKGMLLLLDCRRKPNADDRALLEWIAYHKIPLTLVFTKIDKVGKSIRQREIKKVLTAVDDLLPANTKPLVYSSQTGEGKQQLWAIIRDLTT